MGHADMERHPEGFGNGKEGELHSREREKVYEEIQEEYSLKSKKSRPHLSKLRKDLKCHNSKVTKFYSLRET